MIIRTSILIYLRYYQTKENTTDKQKVYQREHVGVGVGVEFNAPLDTV